MGTAAAGLALAALGVLASPGLAHATASGCTHGHRAAGDGRADGTDLHAGACRRRPCRQGGPRTADRTARVLNATTRAGAAQRIKDGAIPEQVAAELGVSRSTLYRELRKHREGAAVEPVGQEG
ncbi:helix-turn-helix domain-containing protein [Streptomyces griseoruber]